jgi:hypothetical protein
VFFGINAKTYSLNKEKNDHVVSNNSKLPITWIGVGTYALRDFSGAALGFQWGTIGGPMGQSLGIVVGGCVSSGWLYMQNHDHGPQLKPASSPQTSFTNDYEKAGYLHNKFLINFINSSNQIYTTPESYINAVYEPLCQLISIEYNITISEIQQGITKESLIQLITPMNENLSISEYGSLISTSYGNNNISSVFEGIMNGLMPISNTSATNCLLFINSQIEKINSNQNLTDQEKEIMKYSTNILKYSFSLWSNNE